jgi:hypothetical protein
MVGGFLRHTIATSTTVRIIHPSLFGFSYYLMIGLLLAVLPGFVHLHLGLPPCGLGSQSVRNIWRPLALALERAE